MKISEQLFLLWVVQLIGLLLLDYIVPWLFDITPVGVVPIICISAVVGLSFVSAYNMTHIKNLDKL